MKTIILNQRKERDELMSRPYLIRKSIQDTDLLLSSHLIKLITEHPRYRFVIEQPSDQVDNRSSTGGQIYSGIIDAVRQEFRISELRQLSIAGNLGCESGHVDSG